MSLLTSPSVAVRAGSVAMTNKAIVALVSGLVFLPSMLFAMSLHLGAAMAVVAGCCGSLALICGRTGQDHGCLGEPIDATRLLSAVGLALVILLLGGETHLFYATSDWQIRDAVLSDMVAHGFPTAYRIGDADYLLRAPLGMYMLPSLIGRGLGLFAAHVALLVQNALFLGSIFYLMMTIGRGWAHLAIVVLFAGLSLVGALSMLATRPPHGVPFWLELGLDAWHPFFQYSSSMVQFFWVPNHALPGWWLAVLLLLQRPSSPDVATLGVSTAGLAFWSPLAVIPIVPWLIFVLVRNWRPVVLSVRTWLAAAASAGFLPIIAYMLVASLTIAHNGTVARPNFAFWYTMFVGLQLPVLIFLAVAWRHVPREFRALLLVNALVLLVLPFYDFGPNNDLVMRSSIAPLAILAFVFGTVVIDASRKRRIVGFLGWGLVAVATPSAAVEIGRSLSTPRYAISDCSLMEASRAAGDVSLPSNYIAPADHVPTWLLDAHDAPAAHVEKKACWPDRVAPRYFGTIYKPVPKS